MLSRRVTTGVPAHAPAAEALRPPAHAPGLETTAGARVQAGRIAFFFAATGGGVQSKRVVLANALSRRGLRVSCILPEAAGPFLEDLGPDVELIELGTRDPAIVIWRLARYLRTARPAMLIASQQHTNMAALLARRLARSDVPLAVTQHSALSELFRQSRRRSVRWLLPALTRLLLPGAQKIVAVSAGVADDLAHAIGLARERIEVVYNPIVIPDLADRAALPAGHPWLDAKDRPVVLAAGNLIGRKDFRTLVHAFARARAHRPMRLVVLGEGGERQALERLGDELGVGADIDLPGFVPNPFAYMARADLFALSSLIEGLPNVIVEALACGCPIVSTDCRFGPDEILESGRFGRLVPVRDAGALGDAILASLDEPRDPERLRRRAMDFSLDRSVERYIRLIEDLQAGGTHA